MLTLVPKAVPEDVSPAFSTLMVDLPTYQFALDINTMNALTDSLWPYAQVVEFDAVQPDGTSPIFVDGEYAGDAVQLVGLLAGVCCVTQ